MNDDRSITWCFMEYGFRPRVPKDTVLFRCPDSLVYGRSFSDPARHYFSRMGRCEHPTAISHAAIDLRDSKPLVWSATQIAPYAEAKRPERIFAVAYGGASSSFFTLWLAGVLRTLTLGLPVTMLNQWKLKSLDFSALKATDAIVLNKPHLDSFADDWDCFCAGDESWLSRAAARDSNEAAFPSPGKVVASTVSSLRSGSHGQSLDQLILDQLSEASWTTLAVIIGGVYSRIDGLGEYKLLKRVQELSEISSPTLIDVRIDHTAKKILFRDISARLTAAGAKLRKDRIGLGKITPPLWIGGFDARC